MATTATSPPRPSKSKPPYASLAFHNTANYAFLGATALSTVALWDSLGVFPLAVGVGLEVLWMLVGSDLPFVKRRLDAKLAAQAAAEEAERQRALLGAVTEADRRRYHDMQRLQGEIEREVEANPSLPAESLTRELASLARLPSQFLATAHEAARLERFVAQSDMNELERQARAQGLALEKLADPDARALAQKNLAVLDKRIERAKDVHKSLRVARGQLNLIENTVRLVRDQIVTMQSPRELAGQLDELSGSIDAMASARREADAAMQRIERELELSR